MSKKHPHPAIRSLFAAGQRCFGENYVQEALEKQQNLQDLPIEWHFIGPIQSNKTAEIAQHFHWVQSVDREKILRRLASQRSQKLPPLFVCLQVNIDREEQKSGALIESIPHLAGLAASLPGLQLRGLMAIPRPAGPDHNPADSFAAMRVLFENLRAEHPQLDTLSMGMSADLEQAIVAGSTMVRIGTDLFGPRE